MGIAGRAEPALGPCDGDVAAARAPEAERKARRGGVGHARCLTTLERPRALAAVIARGAVVELGLLTEAAAGGGVQPGASHHKFAKTAYI